MHFEHLVEINDPLMPLLPVVSRQQLWRGLIRRAERPTEFVLGLVDATTHRRQESDGELRLTRTLDFGPFQVRDEVVLSGEYLSVTHTQAAAAYPASRLTIRIEEPQPGRLFLRFTYASAPADDPEVLDEATTRLRNQAYESADIDTVVRIRELAESGALG
jgi:hypothetical protein